MSSWTLEDSSKLYKLPHWGDGLFQINDSGHLELRLPGDTRPGLDLHTLVEQLQERGVSLPILIRLTDVLQHRVRLISDSFLQAMAEHSYQGDYRGVYPIKVNQQRKVVEDLVQFGRPYHLGLEAGSKPELMAVLALLEDPEAVIICNGYKDDAYLELALLAQRLGRRCVIVLEQFEELGHALRIGKLLGIPPLLGIRCKLSSPGQGRWEASSGDRSKFGLGPREIMRAVETLREHEMLSCLRMLHFHIGSQVTAIQSFQEALREAGRVFVELSRLGAPIEYFDVGGGLGVDYDGSQSSLNYSMNYNVLEYARAVVGEIQSLCESAGLPHPCIITEAGRALAAHHSVLVFNVLGVSTFPTDEPLPPPQEEDPELLQRMYRLHAQQSQTRSQHTYHEVCQLREQARSAFLMDLMSLEQWSRLGLVFWKICGDIQRDTQALLRRGEFVPEELLHLSSALSDTYYCNFSVFQSSPDAWAVDQLFPCLPLHRLEEEPSRRGVLADITCDSDGQLKRFIDREQPKETLELHPWNGEPYWIGLFMVGAYQEILGDLHNLFGDTNTVHVSLRPGGGYVLEQVCDGDTVSDVLSYVDYNRRDLLERIRRSCEQALEAGHMDTSEARALLRRYREGLEDYTYLKK